MSSFRLAHSPLATKPCHRRLAQLPENRLAQSVEISWLTCRLSVGFIGGNKKSTPEPKLQGDDFVSLSPSFRSICNPEQIRFT